MNLFRKTLNADLNDAALIKAVLYVFTDFEIFVQDLRVGFFFMIPDTIPGARDFEAEPNRICFFVPF